MTNKSGAAGEYLVLGELLRRNVEAYLAHGPTQQGWDIVIFNAENKYFVQVKTIDWPKEKAVNGKLTEGFDILVVVLLNRNESHPKYVVLSRDEVQPFLSEKNEDQKTQRGVSGGRTRTLTLGARFENHETKSSINVDESAWTHLRTLVKEITEPGSEL